jgi:hypothetical protein
MLIWLAKSRGLYCPENSHGVPCFAIGMTRDSQASKKWSQSRNGFRSAEAAECTVCVARIVCSYGFFGWTLDT